MFLWRIPLPFIDSAIASGSLAISRRICPSLEAVAFPSLLGFAEGVSPVGNRAALCRLELARVVH